MTLVNQILTGGGINEKNINILALAFTIFIIKVFLVYYSYNHIAPKLISNIQDEPVKNFKPLTFFEAAIFVILANNLFT
jgi:hydrogenase-4 membrane subunit HyfE